MKTTRKERAELRQHLMYSSDFADAEESELAERLLDVFDDADRCEELEEEIEELKLQLSIHDGSFGDSLFRR